MHLLSNQIASLSKQRIAPFASSMVSTEFSFRNTSPSDSSTSGRYLASDYKRLTNRRTSSPHFTPDSAHEPFRAECSNNGRTANTADKRASYAWLASDPGRKTQASRQSSAIRAGPWTSVKEEEGGKRAESSAVTHLITYFFACLPKNNSSDIQHEVRYTTILS